MRSYTYEIKEFFMITFETILTQNVTSNNLTIPDVSRSNHICLMNLFM